MLKKSLLPLFLLIPMMFLAQDSIEVMNEKVVNTVEEVTETVSEETKVEEEEVGMDKKIDKAFGSATGWFVQGVFWGIPFGEVKDTLVINPSDTNITIEERNDTLFLSDLQVKGRDVTNLSKLNSSDKLTIDDDNRIIVTKADLANGAMSFIASAPYVKIPWVLIVLILGALYFTIYFKFISFTSLRTSINIVRGKYDDLEDEGHVESSDIFPDSKIDENEDNPETIRIEGEHVGEVSHFQALTAALSATVGLGNIAGVAIALSIGGAGATFWMIVAGFLGMASKFVECTLGVKYREIDENGTVFGGPMYYLRKGIKGNFGRILAVIFAIMCIGGSFGGGNMFQVNQAFKMFEHITGGDQSFIHGNGWIFGIVMAVLVGIVIIGGIKKIAKVTDKIVPFMVAIYVLASLFVLITNYDMIGSAFGEIFNGAFTGLGITGGIFGVLIQGFKRAAFSNEAGIGSASIAHSAVKTKHPASEGLVALLEPFIDTVIVCTMTALVIIITGKLNVGASLSFDEGVLLTSSAFESSISWFPWVLTLAVVLFAFSSMISWSYYGYQAWSFLFGRRKIVGNAYKIIFCLFVIVGSASSLSSVIDFSDAMIFAMLVPNMIGLFFLAPKVKEELKKYMEKIKAFKA